MENSKLLYIECLNNDKYLKELITDSYKWRFALENSNIGVWDWNAKTNEVFYSEESKQMIGYEDYEIGNTSDEWDKRVHPEDREAYYRDFNAHLRGELDIYINEHRIRCKDGSYTWILDRGKVVSKDNDGKPTRIIGTHSNITKRKEVEEALKINLDLITNQNDRLHNFTHIVSHNLRTHVGNFESILEFYDQASSENEKEDMVNHLKTISKSLTETITDLNSIISIKSKSDTKALNQRVNLRDVAKKVVESLVLDIKKHNVLIENLIPETIYLNTNVSYLNSVVHNLISNSIKYSSKTRQPLITLNCDVTINTIQLTVKDNGIGIDLNKHEDKIFQLYQTFHGTQREDSKGIGLYITKTQVEALGGTIEVDSTPNQGTCFKVTLNT
ncbi:PAS domain S-box protein [Flavobacteriaceae bacterium 144Ye]|nr:PAS domain S-box protein [Flavobacteriaceae bacterium 144Ye]